MMNLEQKPRIAVVGTGIMGSGIALNYLKHGYPVTVWNRSKNKLIKLQKLGAVAAKTPKEAAEKADIVFEVTANDKSSRSVWKGKNGILAGADNNKILIASATLSLGWVDELVSLTKKLKLNFLDMPMTGGRLGAESGKLIFLVGGEAQKLKGLDHDLDAISETRYYFGKVGAGMRFKLVLNTVQAIHIRALGEALALARAFDLDINKTGEVLTERPGGLATKFAWRDYQKEPEPIIFSIDWITKDLRYAKRSAKGTKTPLLDEVLGKYKKAVKMGMGQKDWTAVNKMQEKKS